VLFGAGVDHDRFGDEGAGDVEQVGQYATAQDRLYRERTGWPSRPRVDRQVNFVP
jgi:hypothetical protein